MNAKLKAMVNYEQVTWAQIVDILKEFAESQWRNIERAVVNRGPFKITSTYKHLSVKEDVFCLLPKEERSGLLRKLAKAPLKVTTDDAENTNYPEKISNAESLSEFRQTSPTCSKVSREGLRHGQPCNIRWRETLLCPNWKKWKIVLRL